MRGVESVVGEVRRDVHALVEHDQADRVAHLVSTSTWPLSSGFQQVGDALQPAGDLLLVQAMPAKPLCQGSE